MFQKILLILLLSSCSAHKRFEKLVQKHPEFVSVVNTTVKDTVIYTDTFVVPMSKDSFIITHDTTIMTEKFIITRRGDKFGVQTRPDTFYKKDTIYKTLTVPGRVIYKKEVSFLSLLPIAILVAAMFLFILYITRRK